MNSHEEVDEYKIVGSKKNAFEIICYYQDMQNRNEFLITSDGYFGSLKVRDRECLVPNDESTLDASGANRKGSKLNHLKADCIGSVLTFSVNEDKQT